MPNRNTSSRPSKASDGDQPATQLSLVLDLTTPSDQSTEAAMVSSLADGFVKENAEPAVDRCRAERPEFLPPDWKSSHCPAEVSRAALVQWIELTIVGLKNAERWLLEDEPGWNGSDLQAKAGTDDVYDCWSFLLLLPLGERGELPDPPITEFNYSAATRWLEGVLERMKSLDLDQDDQYVTLDQMAAIVSRNKKTLERWLANGKLPEPDVEGGGGKPHEWKWSTVREKLQTESRKLMPERYPSLRNVR